jgi:Tfp pilus assembly protein PilF
MVRIPGRIALLGLSFVVIGCTRPADSVPNSAGKSTAGSPESLVDELDKQSAPSDGGTSLKVAQAGAQQPTLVPISEFPTFDHAGAGFTVKGKGSGRDLTRHIDRGSKFFNARNFADAAREFEAAVLADPRDARSQYYLGVTYLELGKHTKSIRHLDTAHNLAPDHDDSLIARASAYLREQRFRKAQDDCDTVIERSADNARAFIIRATCRFHLGEFEAARSDASRSLEIGPQTVDAYFIRCLACARLKSFDEANSDFSQAIELGLPENLAAVAESYLKAGLVKANAGK